jgi:hypothetical protein
VGAGWGAGGESGRIDLLHKPFVEGWYFGGVSGDALCGALVLGKFAGGGW